jgi:hypothetical protein
MPIALAMFAQSLPMYAGIEAFPHRIVWPLAGIHFTGLVLTVIGAGESSQQATWSGMLQEHSS